MPNITTTLYHNEIFVECLVKPQSLIILFILNI